MINNLEQNAYVRIIDSQLGNVRLAVLGVHNFKHLKPNYMPRQEQGYALHYILEGEGQYNIGDKKYSLSANCFFLTPPNISLSYYPTKGNEWKYMWFFLEGDSIVIGELFKSAGLTIEKPVHNCINYREALMMIQMLFDNDMLCENVYSLHTTSVFFRLLSLIARECTKANLDRNSALVEQLKQHIHSGYYNPNYSIKDLSLQMSVSHTYLCRIFRNETGLTMKQYLIDFRLKKAAELIVSTNISIKEASYAVGYIDEIHFSKEFKRKFGVTATKYKHQKNIEKQSDKNGQD